MLKLFFSNKRINMNICKLRQNKDVQNKSIECVLYRVQHLSNKTGKCIHSLGRIWRILRSECLHGGGGSCAGKDGLSLSSDPMTTGGNT